MKNEQFRHLADIFTNHAVEISEINAGNQGHVLLFGGEPLQGLDIPRFQKFVNKTSSSSKSIKIQSLPTTADAPRYHCLGVYYQIQIWIGNKDLSPLD